MIVNLIMVIQVLSALIIVGLVLMQHGKGADMGAAFGSGASGSLFGASGSSNFLSKSTGVAAAVFFTATLALTYLNKPGNSPLDAADGVAPAVPAASAPATPAASAPVAPAASAPAAPAAVPAPAASMTTPPASTPVAVPAPSAAAPAKAAASKAASGK